MLDKDQKLCVDKMIQVIQSGWCRGALAKDRHGREYEDVTDSRATNFCLMGASEKLKYEPNIIYMDIEIVLRELEKLIESKYGHNSIPFYNDYMAKSKKDIISILNELKLQGKS